MLTSIVRLPWIMESAKYRALTIFGLIEIIPEKQPWTTDLKSAFNPFARLPMGYGVYLKKERLCWTKDPRTAASYATAHITRLARKVEMRSAS